MKETARLAGFLAAQAMKETARGVSLCPLIIFEKRDNTTHFVQIRDGTAQQAAEQGEKLLRANADDAARAVMAFDAYLNLEKGKKIDAIFLKAIEYSTPVVQLLFAVPYRHVSKPGGFAVHRPKVFAFEDQQLSPADLVTAFFDGIDKHEVGGPFWHKHYVDSYER